MKPVGAGELSWSIERNCLREDDSSCTPLKREEEKTKQARKPPGELYSFTSFIMGFTPKAIMEVEQWATRMMQLWEQCLDALDKALKVEKR